MLIPPNTMKALAYSPGAFFLCSKTLSLHTIIGYDMMCSGGELMNGKAYKVREVSGDFLICIPKEIAEKMEIEKGQEFYADSEGEVILFTRKGKND